MTECQRCDGCRDNSHHWLPACEQDYDYDCKHCDALGKQCPECFGDGCDECDHEGVILVAGGQKETDRSKLYAAALLPDVELAQLANGGKEFRKDWCQCDPSVGMSPCQYCAIFEALKRTEKYLREQIVS